MKALSQNISGRRRSTHRAAPNRTQVPDQYWGYSLQAVRFLQVLLEAPPGSAISLEVFEDVGRVDPNGSTVASQVKSGLVKNPLTDRSIDFWKTLNNWVVAVEGGILNPDSTVFEIYVGTPRRGQLAQAFHDASTDADATAALEKARLAMWGNGKTRKALPDALSSFVSRVLEADKQKIKKIIQRFRIACATRDPLADLRPLVSVKWVRPESVEIVIQHAHGWLKERLDRQLQERKPAIVSSDEFNEEMLKFLPRCDYRHIVASMAGRPTQDQIEAERMRTYVRQLELIQLEDEGTLEAINNYLRAAVTRTRLSEEGIVHEDSFVDFEEALVAFWRNKRRQNNLTHPAHSEIEKGQLLLSDCCLNRQKLQGLEVPDYFTPGSFHALADYTKIGWHPLFETLLMELGK